MKITNGKVIILIGAIHTLLTPVDYFNQFEIFAHRFFFSINGGFMEDSINYETFAAFWCLYFGLTLFALGVLLDSIERKGMPIPKPFIWIYFGVILIGVYMIPFSGMTVFGLPQAIYMLVSNSIKARKMQLSNLQ